MNASLLQSIVEMVSGDAMATYRALRAAIPDMADTLNGLIVDNLPSAQIGETKTQREFSRFDRESVDASAEREGSAIDLLAELTPERIRIGGRSTGVLDYQRALRREAARDELVFRRAVKRLNLRPYRRAAAREAWQRICALFAGDRLIIAYPDTRAIWERDESPERRAARKIAKLRREMIRVLGALASHADSPQVKRRAQQLFSQLQPVSAPRMRR